MKKPFTAIIFCCFLDEETNFTVGPAQWDAVNKFVQVVGWEFIFGLNSLLRNPYPVGVWDSTNAAQLMAYSSSKGYTVNWELGNGETCTVSISFFLPNMHCI